MRDKLILFWRQMKKIKVLKPLNRLIFVIASSKWFNTVMDYIEVHIVHNQFDDTASYFLEAREKIIQNCKVLADDRSRVVYKNLICYRMTHHRKYFSGDMVGRNQYFDEDLIVWKDSECLVDAGAYDGDTIRRFKKAMEKNKIDWKVVAFEPDRYNYRLLNRMVISDRTCRKKVEIHNLGTWKEKAMLHFQNGMDDSSRVSEDGGTFVPVDTIDAIVGGRKVTFIKMDVEGAELNSLKGARSVILRDHPRLAISIYHSDEDMVEIIHYLAIEYPFYRFYVRHYTWLFTDTICYAVDPELYGRESLN